ncbi:cohesin domain-containing protein [Paenibacillus roseipurpureus]|uniref:Cohesin domain-containing protein n=1 Tax=Paenibacillus roseopurpureus TaxID=2918901 RepID=A0AA96LS16_9BACL|nr:cohesin domain-containing protein [Paenibacillus sp. MBLB1832]WNR46167.1 cohesin domain-containing protein [Paenibacillus sp. MBLB1832]
MKRFSHIVLMALLLFVTIRPVSGAAQTASSFYMHTSSDSVKVGDIVTVTVTGKTLADLYGAEFELNFDATKLKYEDVSSSIKNTFPMAITVSDNKLLLVFTLQSQRAGLKRRLEFVITFV